MRKNVIAKPAASLRGGKVEQPTKPIAPSPQDEKREGK